MSSWCRWRGPSDNFWFIFVCFFVFLFFYFNFFYFKFVLIFTLLCLFPFLLFVLCFFLCLCALFTLLYHTPTNQFYALIKRHTGNGGNVNYQVSSLSELPNEVIGNCAYLPNKALMWLPCSLLPLVVRQYLQACRQPQNCSNWLVLCWTKQPSQADYLEHLHMTWPRLWQTPQKEACCLPYWHPKHTPFWNVHQCLTPSWNPSLVQKVYTQTRKLVYKCPMTGFTGNLTQLWTQSCTIYELLLWPTKSAWRVLLSQWPS